MGKDIVDEYVQSAADLLKLKQKGGKNTRALNQAASRIVDKIQEYTGRGDDERHLFADKVNEELNDFKPA